MARPNSTPTYLAEPTIQYLLQVLEQVRAGEMSFPRFQRFDVWKPEQRRELLRSIRDGIPVGALLLWRTSFDGINTERRIGLHRLPAARKSRVRQYVLDGVQRLSTLYSALYEPTGDGVADDGESSNDFRAYYDLRTEDFLLGRDLGRDGPLDHYLPLVSVLDSVQLLKFQRNLKSNDAERLTERADKIARAFREYKIPVVPLVSDDLDFATKSFQRVNTQGTPMSELHMINALVYRENFDLVERIREAKRDQLAPLGWGALEDELILRTVKALLKIDVYSTLPDETRAALSKKPEVLDNAITALELTAKFLRAKLDIRSPNLVPYGLQIVLLATALDAVKKTTPSGLAALKDWMALTTYTELFSSNMSASRFDALAQELRSAAQGKPLVWNVRGPLVRRDLPPTFDFRHARARFLALEISGFGAQKKKAKANDYDPYDVLAEEGASAMLPLITAKMVKETGAWMRSPGARFVVPAEEAKDLRDHLLSREASDDFLRAHLVSKQVHGLLLRQEFEKAVNKREQDLNEHERRVFDELISRHAPLGVVVAKQRTAGKGELAESPGERQATPKGSPGR